MIAVSRPDISLRLLNSDPKGVLSAEVRKPGCKPLAIIAVYVPHSASNFSDWATPILDFVSLEYHRLQKRYNSDIIIAGDFNCRLGRLGGRATADPTSATTGSGSRDRRDLLAGLCRRLRVSPLHGRDVQRPAQCTSRPVTADGAPASGGAEVDFILASNSLPPSTFSAHDPPDWHCLPIGVTHRPIGATITVSQQRDTLIHHTVAPRRTVPFRAGYDDKRWHVAAKTIADHVDSQVAVMLTRLHPLKPRAPCKVPSSPARNLPRHQSLFYHRQPMPSQKTQSLPRPSLADDRTTTAHSTSTRGAVFHR